MYDRLWLKINEVFNWANVSCNQNFLIFLKEENGGIGLQFIKQITRGRDKHIMYLIFLLNPDKFSV